MTKIVQITKKEIFLYHDYSFMVFERANLINGAEFVGICWAAGKTKNIISGTPIPGKIKRDTCYHHILLMALVEMAEENK